MLQPTKFTHVAQTGSRRTALCGRLVNVFGFTTIEKATCATCLKRNALGPAPVKVRPLPVVIPVGHRAWR